MICEVLDPKERVAVRLLDVVNLALQNCFQNMLWICVVNVGVQLTLGSWIQAMLACISDRACAVALHCRKLWLVEIMLAFWEMTVNFFGSGLVVDHPNGGCCCIVAMSVCWNP